VINKSVAKKLRICLDFGIFIVQKVSSICFEQFGENYGK
jgi:hypothetical protein